MSSYQILDKHTIVDTDFSSHLTFQDGFVFDVRFRWEIHSGYGNKR